MGHSYKRWEQLPGTLLGKLGLYHNDVDNHTSGHGWLHPEFLAEKKKERKDRTI